MQPLSLSEMRETLRKQGLQNLRKISDRQPLQTTSRPNIMPCQRSKTGDSIPAADSIDTLKRKLRELEDERSAFLQEGVFDLVQFLCGRSLDKTGNSGASESSWAAQVISSVECLRQHERDKYQEENRKLKLVLQKISDLQHISDIHDLAKSVLDELRNS